LVYLWKLDIMKPGFAFPESVKNDVACDMFIALF
jgi:hypothetical protein